MTTPTEFTLWLNGATDFVDGVPSPEQWMQVKEKLTEAMGYLAKQRLLERADGLVRMEEEMTKRESFAKAAMDLKIREMQAPQRPLTHLHPAYSGMIVGGMAKEQIYRDPATRAEIMIDRQESVQAQAPSGFMSALKARLGGAV